MNFKEPFVGLVCERLCIKKYQNIWWIAAVDKALNLYKITELRNYRSARNYLIDYNTEIKENSKIGFIKPGTIYKWHNRTTNQVSEHNFNYFNPGWIFAKEILN